MAQNSFSTLFQSLDLFSFFGCKSIIWWRAFSIALDRSEPYMNKASGVFSSWPLFDSVTVEIGLSRFLIFFHFLIFDWLFVGTGYHCIASPWKASIDLKEKSDGGITVCSRNPTYFWPRVTKWSGLKNDFVVVVLVLGLVLCRHFLKFDVFRHDFSHGVCHEGVKKKNCQGLGHIFLV